MLPLVYSRVKNGFSETKKTLYGMTDDNFSTVASSSDDAVFPFAFLKMMSPTEIGKDTEGTSYNAGNFTFQWQVTDNRSQGCARDVMDEIIKVMLSMRFNVYGPETDDMGNTHTCTARFSRVIGVNDKL